MTLGHCSGVFGWWCNGGSQRCWSPLSMRHQQLQRVLQPLTARDALLWNTMVGITIGAALLRWALNR